MSQVQHISPSPKNILFVCTANRYRSRTAMEFFRMKYGFLYPEWKFDSCGTAPIHVAETKKCFSDAKELTPALIEWADVIICMVPHHMLQIRGMAQAHGVEKLPPITVLGFEDDFIYMSTNLIRILNDAEASLWGK